MLFADSTVEFTKEEMHSHNNGPWWLRPWFVFSSEWQLLLFSTYVRVFLIQAVIGW